jgi:hypothetical protein
MVVSAKKHQEQAQTGAMGIIKLYRRYTPVHTVTGIPLDHRCVLMESSL